MAPVQVVDHVRHLLLRLVVKQCEEDEWTASLIQVRNPPTKAVDLFEAQVDARVSVPLTRQKIRRCVRQSRMVPAKRCAK